MTIDERIQAMGLVLPEAFRSPMGAAYPFSWVRVRGNRAYVSGHLPLQADGTLAEPRGKVGESLTSDHVLIDTGTYPWRNLPGTTMTRDGDTVTILSDGAEYRYAVAAEAGTVLLLRQR